MLRRGAPGVALSILSLLAAVPALAGDLLPPPSECQQAPVYLCLDGGRFQVQASWTSGDRTGAGTAVRLTEDSGYFWFFDPSNTELVVKILDGCAINNAYWFFAAGLTDVQVRLQMIDTKDGSIFTPLPSPEGTPFEPIQNTTSLSTSCP